MKYDCESVSLYIDHFTSIFYGLMIIVYPNETISLLCMRTNARIKWWKTGDANVWNLGHSLQIFVLQHSLVHMCVVLIVHVTFNECDFRYWYSSRPVKSYDPRLSLRCEFCVVMHHL